MYKYCTGIKTNLTKRFFLSAVYHAVHVLVKTIKTIRLWLENWHMHLYTARLHHVIELLMWKSEGMCGWHAGCFRLMEKPQKPSYHKL